MNALRFKLNRNLTLFSASFLPLLIYLGFWQLDRAEQKVTLLEKWSQQQHSSAIPFNRVDDTTPDYSATFFTGTFDRQRYWLQEGKIHKGQPGYFVYMLAETVTREHVLVNRGWTPANPDRRILPELNSPLQAIRLSGYIKTPSQHPLINESENPVTQWPHRILEIDTNTLGKQTGKHIQPRVVHLDAENEWALIVPERKVAVTPEKHRGYAIQWFSMAITLFLLWFAASTNIIQLLKNKNAKDV